jgi:hypothetical protein
MVRMRSTESEGVPNRSMQHERDIQHAATALPAISLAAWNRAFDLVIIAGLALLDRIAPLPEAEIDRAIREEGERLPRRGSL